MFGQRRRKVNQDQAPRDQFSRKLLQGTFSPFATSVADSRGFVSTGYFSSRARRAAPVSQRAEDFMDASDFDASGRSQVSVARKTPYFLPSGAQTGFSDEEAALLFAFGFAPGDLRAGEVSNCFADGNQPYPAALAAGYDWLEVPQRKLVQYEVVAPPAGFKALPVKLPLRDLATGNMFAADEQIEDFNFLTMFHVEGEKDIAKEFNGAPEKRTVVAWVPAKILKKRFSIDVSGKAANADDESNRKRRND